MKRIIQIALWLISIGLVYLIYDSINAPIRFGKVKKERYTQVIERLKDIRDAQIAHRTVTGKFASDFNGLIKFIDTAQFTLTETRDSSYMEYDENFRIDMLREVKVIDTLGFVPVKDSLFKNSDRYKSLETIPEGSGKPGSKFTMKSDMIDKNGFKIAVFEARIDKNLILHDQPDYLLQQEREHISVEEVNGPDIVVGSLGEVSTNGNWPTIYDTPQNN
ncbi:hypothetical protein ABN763_17215 [Spongiivirga sp. MCCC 1A20706]|uniref:hypothetical protein n=1 Tax=Spongiivirga sp. MCCC 1A20706 TaxID=3160963 RepID=UPI003977DBD0